ncbi:glycosyltransferase family 2 protein [Candidatus Gracilibacteria bacterium]|nr:MAG: glycosyltransferase family 2 protein [Candidatus Gracilibacteria bacterium]
MLDLISNGYKNILVVNDGSIDSTKNILEKFSDKIVFLNHPTNRGAGAALETGFEYIRRFVDVNYIITFDSDGQHLVSDIKKFLDKFEQDEELGAIFGSRFLQKSETNVPFFRRIVLFLGKIFTFLVSGVMLTDAHNGLRGFRLETIKKIKLKMDSMAYASELIDEIRKNKIKYSEVFVVIKYTDYSIGKGQSSLNAINIAIKVIFNKIFK